MKRLFLISIILSSFVANSYGANFFSQFGSCESRLKSYFGTPRDVPQRNIGTDEAKRTLEALNRDFGKAMSVHKENTENFGECYKNSKLFPRVQKNLDALNESIMAWEKALRDIEHQNKQDASNQSSAKSVIAQNQDVLTFKNSAVELIIKAIAVDVQLKRVFFRITLQNVSKGQIIHPVTTSGNTINTGAEAKMLGELYTVDAIPSGIQIEDSYKNRYEIEYIVPSTDGSQQIMPGEKTDFEIRINGKIVETSDYIKIKFSSDITNSGYAEIKIPMEIWKKIAVVHQKSCSADCLAETEDGKLGL